MIKPFDSTFLTSSVLVVVALGLAWAVVARVELPLIGTGIGALLAVGVIGLASCAIGGIGTVASFDLTSPQILVGTVLGVVALLVIVAGLIGWTAPFQPLVQLVPGQAATLSAAQLATFALAIVIAVKWLIALGLAVTAR